MTIAVGLGVALAPTSARAEDSPVRDVDCSPDGRFFVVTTTGGYGGSNTPCDTSTRWETDSTGTDVQPSWVDYTGGDTTYGVEVTDNAVYVGGHFRWQNNPFRGNAPGPGAVGREGIAALDPINGLPLSWNPGRTKGVGVFDFLHSTDGLWVASDTDRIGNWQLRSRIALMRPDRAILPAVSTPGLPNDLYALESSGTVPDPSVLHRVNAGGPEIAVPVGPVWEQDTAGSPSPHHNSGQNAAGWDAVPTVDATVPASTPRDIYSSELWDPGALPEQQWDFPVAAGTPIEVRLYFANRCTCTDQESERVFDVDLEGVRVLDDLDLVATVDDDVGTMRFFAITSDGNVDIDLFHVVENPLINGIEIVRTDMEPVEPEAGDILRREMTRTSAGEAQAVPDGGIDWNTVRGAFMLNGWLYAANAGIEWNAKDYFLFHDADGLGGDGGGGGGDVNESPTASFTVSCVELTVVDDDGASGTTTREATTVEGTAGEVAFVGVDSSNANSAEHEVTVPAAAKSSYAVDWTPPAGHMERSSTDGAGGGRISAMVADTGGAVPSETYQGATASAAPSVGRVVTLTAAVAPQGDGG